VTLLELDGLSVAYPAGQRWARAVRGVSLSVAAGEVVGLAGESGCGKTSVAMSVLRLLPRTAKVTGRIRFGGTDLTGATWGELRAVRWAQAAVVFQGAQHALNPMHRIGTQIAEPALRHGLVTRSAAAAHAADLLQRVGLAPELARDHPHQLSGGQRQRALLATALSCSPRLLIADEPTSALDSVSQAAILCLLRELAAERGIGVLLVSHDLGALAAVCDRIAVMYAGRIVEQGSAEAVLGDPAHPYTEALTGAATVIGDPATRYAPRSLGGAPPDPLSTQPGCAFAPRCPHAGPDCGGEIPLRPAGPGRLVECVRVAS
jgi:peptide/nickel transport system ATP-binding protein